MGQELVPSDLCVGEDRPRNTKQCEEVSCLQYSWTVGNWSEVNSVFEIGTIREERRQSLFLTPAETLTYMSCVMGKQIICICENKGADQLCGIQTADQRLCFRYIVQSLYYLNPKFQASSHLLWLNSPVCVGPGRKPRRLVFSQRGSCHQEQVSLAGK